jgi:hypothetical protein
MAAKDPEIRVKLEVGGEDFRTVGHVTKALRRASIQPKIEDFGRKPSGEGRDRPRICGRWVTLVPE